MRCTNRRGVTPGSTLSWNLARQFSLFHLEEYFRGDSEPCHEIPNPNFPFWEA